MTRRNMDRRPHNQKQKNQIIQKGNCRDAVPFLYGLSKGQKKGEKRMWIRDPPTGKFK